MQHAICNLMNAWIQFFFTNYKQKSEQTIFPHIPMNGSTTFFTCFVKQQGKRQNKVEHVSQRMKK